MGYNKNVEQWRKEFSKVAQIKISRSRNTGRPTLITISIAKQYEDKKTMLKVLDKLGGIKIE